jgi:hypothetical protein
MTVDRFGLSMTPAARRAAGPGEPTRSRGLPPGSRRHCPKGGGRGGGAEASEVRCCWHAARPRTRDGVRAGRGGDQHERQDPDQRRDGGPWTDTGLDGHRVKDRVEVQVKADPAVWVRAVRCPWPSGSPRGLPIPDQDLSRTLSRVLDPKPAKKVLVTVSVTVLVPVVVTVRCHTTKGDRRLGKLSPAGGPPEGGDQCRTRRRRAERS